MKTLVLHKIVFEYRDDWAESEWKKRLDRHVRMSDKPFDEPMPQRKRGETYAAVSGGFGSEPIATACDLAIFASICPRDGFDKYQPTIVSVECIGSVVCQET